MLCIIIKMQKNRPSFEIRQAEYLSSLSYHNSSGDI